MSMNNNNLILTLIIKNQSTFHLRKLNLNITSIDNHKYNKNKIILNNHYQKLITNSFRLKNNHFHKD